MASAEDIKIRILAVDDASKTINKVGTNLKGLRGIADKSFAGIKTAAGSLRSSLFSLKGAVAGIGLGFAAKESINVAGNFENLRVSLKTVTGSAENAQKEFDRLLEWSNATPYQVEEAVQAFVKLKAMGLDPSERSLNAYGNTASAMGKSLDQMIEAVADASVGEFERLKEFGIKAKKEGENVTFTFQGQEHTIKATSDNIQKYLLSLGETKFAGGMEDQSKTLNGLLSTLYGNVKSQTDKIINETGILQWTKEVTQAAIKWVQSLDPKEVAAKFMEIKTEIGSMIDKVKEMWSSVKEVGSNAIQGLVDIFNDVKAKVYKIMISILEGVQGVMDKLSFILPDGAKKGVDGMLDELYRGYDEAVGHSIVPDMVDEIGDHMKRMGVEMVDNTKTGTDGMLDAFKDASKGVGNEIANIVTGTQTLGGALRSIGRGFVNRAIGASFKPMEDALNSWADGLFSANGGGFTGYGARSGGVDGKGGFPAILHPNETVVDHTKGQSMGQSVVQNINVTTGVSQTVRAEIANMMPQIIRAAQSATADARMRGGSYSSAMGA